MDSHHKTHRQHSRCAFLKTAMAMLGAGVASQSIVIPPLVHAAEGDKVRLAAVGAGGKGVSDIRETSKGQIVVALCDYEGPCQAVTA